MMMITSQTGNFLPIFLSFTLSYLIRFDLFSGEHE